MTTEIRDSFQYLIIVLKFFGLYPTKNVSFLSKISPYFGIPLWILNVVLISVNLVVGTSHDIVEFSITLFSAADGGTGVVKMFMFFKHKQRIKNLINFFKNFKPRNEGEDQIVQECVRVCKKLSMAYLICIFVDINIWIFRPFFLSENKIFLNVWLPYDLEDNGRFYGSLLFFSIGTYYAAITVLTMDPLVGVLAYNGVTHIKILKYILLNIDKYASDNLNESEVIKFESVFPALKRCVIYHNEILEFVAEFEKYFSWILFAQFVGSTLGLGFCYVGLLQPDLAAVDMAVVSVSYLVMLFPIFFFCFFGTLLFEENESLNEAIYMSPWYRCDVKIRKFLIILMERSKRPMTITAGKIVFLTLPTFTWVLKTSYSLIAVMKNFQK